MPKLQEKPPKEDVVVEPDLPVGAPSPSPAGPTPEPPQDVPVELDPDIKAGLERLAKVGIVDSTGAEISPERAEYLCMVASMPSTEPVFVAGTRAPRLKVGAYTLQPGEIVPGAQGWLRRESYERLGRIERR